MNKIKSNETKDAKKERIRRNKYSLMDYNKKAFNEESRKLYKKSMLWGVILIVVSAFIRNILVAAVVVCMLVFYMIKSQRLKKKLKECNDNNKFIDE